MRDESSDSSTEDPACRVRTSLPELILEAPRSTSRFWERTDTFRISEMMESPSLVEQGPAVTLKQMEVALKQAAKISGIDMSSVKAVGLDTPGPASADGVISAQGSTNFGNSEWATVPNP